MPSVGIDLLVCDMNVHPDVAADLLCVVSRTALLAPHCRLVFTTKGLAMSAAAVHRFSDAAMRRLVQNSGLWAMGTVVHLLSNGQERTVLAGLQHTVADERSASVVSVAVEEPHP